jgi:hypothetical protein
MTKNEAIEYIENGQFPELSQEKKEEVLAALKDNYDDFENWESSNCEWNTSNC